MDSNLKFLTKDLVEQAASVIDSEGIPKKREGKEYEVEIGNKFYPFKLLVTEAAKLKNIELNPVDFGSSSENRERFKELTGLECVKINDPIKPLIEKYKKRISKTELNDEIYKWELVNQFKGRPNPEIGDFYQEIKAVKFNNLIYAMGMAVIHHLAKEKPEELRQLFVNLFDENQDLTERVKLFNAGTLKIYRELGETLQHHQDERSIATYLTFHNSDKYTFYKSSFYKKYCKLIGIKEAKKNEKYVHYLSLIDELIEKYIETDTELIEQVKKLIPDFYDGTNHKLLAQDILYQTLDKRFGETRKYWRIGTSDIKEKNNYWDYMKENNVICIGWSEVGDLNNVEIHSKKDVIKIFNKLEFYSSNKSLLSRKAGELFNFYEHINTNDVVIAQQGDDVLGVGIVTEEYMFDERIEFSHHKHTNWIITEGISLKNSLGRNTTVFKIDDPNLINQVDNLIESKVMKSQKCLALNQILFGPPGTGKTFNTINKAIEIINPSFNLEQKRDIIKAEYERLVSNGQIVFTTFHQSMSYEDFVEGIKPQEPISDGDPISYEIEDGIFKKSCINAAFSIANKNLSVETKNVLDFADAFDSLVDYIEDQQSKSNQVEFKTKNGGRVIVDGISQQGNIIIKHPGRENIYSISKQRLAKLHKAFPDLSEVNNIDTGFRSIIGGSNSTANWAVLNAIRDRSARRNTKSFTDKTYSYDEKKEAVSTLSIEDYKNKNGDPFVLIIDEINRGNVSQIFGELITLIEDDKRLGKEEALEIMLPYSKEKFGVPSNLYIIGTMNTADRSVEALDTALRRRFSFDEKMPDYQVLRSNCKTENGILKLGEAEINLVELLQTINRRVEVLLDRDHLIGHSYFLNVDSKKSLLEAFDKKIIPLLQEYFFGDYGKISLVLGEGFCKGEKVTTTNGLFAKALDYDVSIFEDQTIYNLINVEDKEFDIEEALKRLFNKETKKKESSEE